MDDSVCLRAYRSEDLPALTQLFYDTVHTVNAGDYSQEQLDAWATGQVDLEAWDCSLREHYTVVAEEDGLIVGFGDLDATGYLDRLFVHKDRQGRGIATAICCALEAHAPGHIVSHVSITARPFFELRGYQVLKAQQAERGGVLLTNFIMKKERDTYG